MTETKDLGKLWAERMTKSERDQTFPDVEPRDAATLMLIDRAGPVPKVLLGKRHHGHKFMPGKYVFPGGGLEPADKRVPVAHGLDPHAEASLMREMKHPSSLKARALALAAI